MAPYSQLHSPPVCAKLNKAQRAGAEFMRGAGSCSASVTTRPDHHIR